MSIYVLAGQSNAGLRGDWADLSVPSTHPQQGKLYWSRHENQGALGGIDSKTNGATLVRPVDGRYGVEITFAQSMPDGTALVRYSRSASGLHPNWKPSTNLQSGIYPRFLGFVAEARAVGIPGDIAGLLWIQGGNDASAEHKAVIYAANMTEFIGQLRTDWALPTLPVVVVRQHIDTAKPFTTIVRAQQEAWVSADPYATLVDIDDLALAGDSLHHTGTTQEEIGRRLAGTL